MTMIRHLAFVMAALLFAGLPRAVAQDDYALFSDRAGSASLLYRGHKAYEYALLYNGTYYLSSPEYLPGSVVYNGKFYRDILLNIDAARQDLIVRIGKGVSNKVLEREFVQECTIGGRRFLHLQYIYGETAPFGFWEVVYDGKTKVLRRVIKRLEQDVDGSKRDETHYEGVYRDNLYQTFIYTATYCYLQEDGTILPVRRRRDVFRLVDKSHRRELRRYIHEQESNGQLPFDRFCAEAARYMESR